MSGKYSDNWEPREVLEANAKNGNPPNPKQQYGDKKVPLYLLPPLVAMEIVDGLREGAEKYGPWNWREDPVETMTYIGAAMRHLAAYVEGEDIDPDSAGGKSHIAGALASLAILVDAQGCGTLIDNRPRTKNPKVLERLKQGARLGGYAQAITEDPEFAKKINAYMQSLDGDLGEFKPADRRTSDE